MKSSVVGSDGESEQRPELPEVLLMVRPQLGSFGSILKKNSNGRNERPLKIEALTEEVDVLRKRLREIAAKMTQTLVPAFSTDIDEMNKLIEG